ncbi:MAG TPA: hypothetical protein VHK24_04580 [Steroidobacter sp.]|jgi:hypothetical protein|nr:hypothetical protein [Steroidobacter sp.]
MQVRVITCATLSLLSLSVHAGTVMETVTRDLNNPAANGTTLITTHAQDGRMRVEAKPGDSVMIFKDDVIYNIDKKDKTYVAMDRELMKQMADQINPALKAMREQLAKMPPEQRAQVEKMMNARMGDGMNGEPQQIRTTGRKGQAAGRACTYAEARQGGTLTDEFCVVSGGALQGSQDLLVAARKLSALVQEMFSNLDAPWLKELANRQADYEKIGGVPVLSRHYADGNPVSETTLQTIRAESLPASLFDVPAGFKKKDMMAR